MNNRFYLVKQLTNTKGEDGSGIAVYTDDDPEVAKNNAIVAYHSTLAAFHNADDVLYAVVMIQDSYGNVLGGPNKYKEVVDHTVPEEE